MNKARKFKNAEDLKECWALIDKSYQIKNEDDIKSLRKQKKKFS